MNDQKESEVAKDFANKHFKEGDNFSKDDMISMNEVPAALQQTLLVQGRMILAVLSHKPMEKLEALRHLRIDGFTHDDAKRHVDALLKEMAVAVE